MIKNEVFIKKSKETYNNVTFMSADFYEELNNFKLNVTSDKEIFDDVRNLLINMNLDFLNIGKNTWNPFKEFIKPNNVVVIKPNFVKHENKEGTIDCLITNFSVIRPIIEYTILALDGTGKIIVGDAPVQNCDFEQLKLINDMENQINKYKEIYPNIEMIDFRKNQNPNIECKIVKIDEFSSFSELDGIEKEYSITNYNLDLMSVHHKGGTHEYIIPTEILKADVIINMPKPKTHRKAGMTACMKNFVGINGNKECLPHHRTGGPNKNGDEFPENNIIKNLYSWVCRFTYTKSNFIKFVRKVLLHILKILKKDRFYEGSWYGNDTIWRTILDLNKLILYVDKKGKLTKKKQRQVFNIVDMIISGEKEGPLLPSDKKVGLILGGFNQLNIDYTIAQIMGFKPEKIKYIENGYKLKELKISDNKQFKVFDDNGLVKDMSIYNKQFKATDGWKDCLEEKEN